MSFHGGFLGVALAVFIFARKTKKSFLTVGDFVVPLVPIGLGMGRLGNFINSELWGRQTDVPWAMVFPTDKLQVPRHPSQLYEFALEGAVLFAILYFISRKTNRLGLASGAFLIGYGVFRSFIEFFREPDAHLGLYFSFISKGQILSIPMILAGILIIYLGHLSQQKAIIAQGAKAQAKGDKEANKKSAKGNN